MTVYVDDMRAPYRRMVMCHMLADTEAELHAMAAAIGVARRWHQGDHYDIALTKRAAAVQLGAVEITLRQAGAMHARRKATGALGAPGDAWDWLKKEHERRRWMRQAEEDWARSMFALFFSSKSCAAAEGRGAVLSAPEGRGLGAGAPNTGFAGDGTTGRVKMDESIVITRPQLRAALLRWGQDERAGKTRGRTETLALPVDQVADESTTTLWQLLEAVLAAA